jgi:hypothetical protein
MHNRKLGFSAYMLLCDAVWYDLRYADEGIAEQMTNKPSVSAQPRDALPTKAAARKPLEKVIPAPAKRYTQKPKGRAAVQETSRRQSGSEKVMLDAAKPVVSVPDAFSDTIAVIADTGSVSEQVGKPIAAINTTTPSPMLGTRTMTKNTQEFVAFGRANMDAFAKFGQVWAAGVQELMKQFATATKVYFDESAFAFTAIGSAKSVTAAMDLQSKFASRVAKTGPNRTS